MSTRNYHFKGSTNDIINSILSLLLGKEQYREVSLYSNFLNDSNPPRYNKKMKAILDLMQKENLILVRNNPESAELKIVSPGDDSGKINSTQISEPARVFLRQHGKEVLSDGGFKRTSSKNKNSLSPVNVSSSSKLTILLVLIAAIWYLAM
jgi:hypothetical protein